MKIIYFDCFSGISGDMVLGSIVDAGVDQNLLITELAKLKLTDEYDLRFQKVTKLGIAGTKAIVETAHHSHESDHSHGPSRHLSDIFSILDHSELDERTCVAAKRIFDKLAEAEAKVHNTDKTKVHLHEVSGIDSIIDIVGSVIGISILGADEIFASPLSLGRGFVKCAHGTMPVPVPGTLELLQGIPIRQTEIAKELVTPTGAAIITTLSNGFGVMPNMTVNRVGYGAGSRDLEMQPNLLRICIGDKTAPQQQYDKDRFLTSEKNSTTNYKDSIQGFNDNIQIIETNVDDMSPEISAFVMKKLFDHGALDVFFVPISMKKNRPAIQINLLCPTDKRNQLIEIILTETTTFGVRFYNADRVILDRDYIEINTQWGPVKAKRGYLNGTLIKTVPEYEDCKSLAESNDVSLLSVFQEVLRKI